MDIRYFIDPETGLPHIYRHGVTEEEVEDVLRRPIEDRPGREGSRVAWLEGAGVARFAGEQARLAADTQRSPGTVRLAAWNLRSAWPTTPITTSTSGSKALLLTL